MRRRLTDLFKKDTVLVIAAMLAVISMFFNRPSKEYIDFIDFRVLGILLALMIVMAGLQVNGIFDRLGRALVSRCNTTRKLCLVLVFMCFFSGMVLTNDVALITFVPFALLTLKLSGKEKLMVKVVVYQTIAANLGSMLTPMGNPQNLYLYGLSGKTMGDFVMLTLPYTIVAALLLCLLIMLIKSESISMDNAGEEKKNTSVFQVCVYLVLFVLCILTVLRIVEWYIVAIIVVAVAAVMDRRVLLKADYSLLLTFIAFFIFIGNMGELQAVRDMLSSLIEGRELAIAIISSQVVSNVPAALLLSGFTGKYDALIVGVNLGGLGTLIASMASLISYKLFVNEYPDSKRKYFIYFTVVNIVFLVVLLFTHRIISG